MQIHVHVTGLCLQQETCPSNEATHWVDAPFHDLRLEEPKKLLDWMLHPIDSAASVSTKSQKVLVDLADLSEDAFP